MTLSIYTAPFMLIGVADPSARRLLRRLARRFGDYTWMRYADAALATFAALTNLPIREAPVLRAAARA